MYIYKRTRKLIKSKNDQLINWLVPLLVMKKIVALMLGFFLQRKYNPFFPKTPNTFKKKCVFTVLIGDYDHLQEPAMVAEGWDYLCITNNPNLTSSVWTFIHIDDEGMDPVRLSRKYKICNHLD